MARILDPFWVRKWFRRATFGWPYARTLLAPRVHTEVAPAPYADIGLASLNVLTAAPVWMSRSERLLLYTLVFSLRPQRYLEIGSLYGGSALIVCAALDALDASSKMILVDPAPRIEPLTWAQLAHRATLVTGFSPGVLAKAEESAGAKFDFVLIDGDHNYHAVVQDLVGVIAHCSAGAYILCHDCFYHEVQAAIDDFVGVYAGRLVDFGAMTRENTSDPENPASEMLWGGIRVLQIRT